MKIFKLNTSLLIGLFLLSLNSASSWHGGCDPNDYLCVDDSITRYSSGTDFFANPECDPFIDSSCTSKNDNKSGDRQALSASDTYLSNCENEALGEYFIAQSTGLAISGCEAAREKKASIEAGKTAYNNGNYRKSFHIFKPLAELAQGDAIAQQKIGQMYYEGKGVPQDYNEALYWYGKSYNHGHITEKEYQKILSIGRAKDFNPNNFKY
ncbi:MAG: hypothetical protein NZ735_09450 [Candidatus Marinimicrobia bacterium]|nr:hypothetical protein [Candidatus Neomarinimicrobiota bacterium]